MDVQGHCLGLPGTVSGGSLLTSCADFLFSGCFPACEQLVLEKHTLVQALPCGRGWGWEGWKMRNLRCGSRPQGFYHPNLPSIQVGTSTRKCSK